MKLHYYLYSACLISLLLLTSCRDKIGNDYKFDYSLSNPERNYPSQSDSLSSDSSATNSADKSPSASPQDTRQTRETKETRTHNHHATSPNDPMFGFDYYDDEDDDYNLERNQIDPYPDDFK